MGRFEQIASQVALLRPNQQDAMADVLETALAEVDTSTGSLLSDGQAAEVRLILSKPLEWAEDSEVEAFFASLGDGTPV
jgi:hypothetical protein